MPRLDKFIRPMLQGRSARLTLASGERISLISKAGATPLTPEPLALEQVRGLLEEIWPSGLAHAAAEGRPVGFRYAAPSGEVQVTVTEGGGGLRVLLEPAGAASGAAEGAAAQATAGGAASSRSIDALLRKLVAEKCSDLHLSIGMPPLFRKDGDIVALGDMAPISAESARDLLYAIAPPRHRARFEETHDVDFSHEIPGLARFRCNLFMDRMGAGGVIRVIPSKIPTAEDLGLPKQVLELCHLTKGLILVTGPTGSGKSTTLAAMIDYINRGQSAHIITVEDPIEFVHQNHKCLVNQREIGTHTDTFKSALRAALREDPDIVLVGEMRDLETVAIAIETAETGHLVLGTLHTNTAPSAVDRMIDQFPTDRQAQVRTMLSESLKGVIAQTLCKRKGGGRVAALEILIVNPAIGNLIREGKTFQIPSLMQAGKGAGMVCLSDALYDLVRRGLVDPAEAYAKAIAKTEFKALLSRGGVQVEAAGPAA